MSVRETITDNPRIGIAAAGGLFLIGVIVIFLEMRSPAVAAAPSQFYFTVDDGKTWFADAATNVPPFDKNGQQAVRAHVYRCHDGTKFVAYLERFTPRAKHALENPSGAASGDLSTFQAAYGGGREVKRPGDKVWLSITNPQAVAQVMLVKCPD
jgi:hypothetical protein